MQHTVTLTHAAWLREAERCAKLARWMEAVECNLAAARRYQRLARECERRANG
jgi:hypothetical protein